MKHAQAPDHIFWLLLQIAFRAKHGLMKLAESHGLTAVQVHTLSMMKPSEPIPMNMLSCMLGCDASNVTGIVDRLLAMDLIKKQESSEDRRVKMITLTKKGEKMRTVLFKELIDYTPPELKELSDIQRHDLHEALEEMVKSAGQRRGASW